VVPGELDSGSAALNFLSKRPSLIQEVTIDVTLYRSPANLAPTHRNSIRFMEFMEFMFDLSSLVSVPVHQSLMEHEPVDFTQNWAFLKIQHLRLKGFDSLIPVKI
jgi:hypothetical protein